MHLPQVTNNHAWSVLDTTFSTKRGTDITWNTERIAQNLTGCHDLANLHTFIEDLWVKIVTTGQIDNFTTSEHEMTYKQFNLLKKVVRYWRFGEPRQWVLSYAEFRRGVKMLDEYIPPLIISQNQYATHVRPFCNFRGFLGGMGFRVSLTQYTTAYQDTRAHTHTDSLRLDV